MLLPKPRNINVERYIGGLSKFEKIDNPIKLSANESALGPSPKAIEAFEKDKGKIFNYPESDSNSLREVMSKKFKIDAQPFSMAPPDSSRSEELKSTLALQFG